MTQTENSSPAARRAPRWMKIVLGVSLAFNVLIIAAVGGLAIRHGGPHGGAGFRDLRSFARFAPEEHRDEARAVLERHQEDYRAGRQRIRDARQEAADIFKADPYNEEALESALSEIRAASGDIQALAHGAMVEIGAGMTAEQRAEVIEKLGKRSRRWRKRDGERVRDE